MSSSNNDQNKIHVEADEKHLLLDHDYDGIQELNHPLPNWWNFIFYACFVFAGVYFVYYQMMGGPSLKDEFKQDYAKVVAVQEELKKQSVNFNPEMWAQHNTPEGIEKGKAVYEMNCLPCHAENAKGDIGPNLTDDHWIVAKGTPETMYPVVFNGSDRGVGEAMPPWGDVLAPEEIYQAIAYVLTFKNTNQPGGKAPQGEKLSE